MRQKKGILLICDGLGGRPDKRLNFKTPLEYAKTPNLNKFLKFASCGNIHPVKPGIRVGTDTGHLAIFGYNPFDVYTGRGPIEAYSAGIEMEEGDIAFRGNFATVDENFHVIDRRAQRINKGTTELAEAINEIQLQNNIKVIAKELTAHRLVIVLKGTNLSSKITDTDPGTANEGLKIIKPSPTIDINDNKDEYNKAKYTSKIIWELTLKIHKILSNHKINKERKLKGLLPANIVILRGAGIKLYIPKITDKFGFKGAVIAGDKTITGIGKMVGLDPFSQDDFTGEFETNYIGKAKLALKLLNKNYDWVVVHVKAPDLAGHDNDIEKKVKIIENIDKMAGIFYNNIDLSRCYFTFTADHSTPCEVRDHTSDPVPSFISGIDVRRDGIFNAGESYFKNGSLNNFKANDLFLIQMDYMGFTKKYGA